MKKYAILFLLLLLTASPVVGQKRRTDAKPVGKNAAKTSPKSAPKKASSGLPAAPAAEIPAKEWDAITGALEKEDWTQAAALSAVWLGKLNADNDKMQLAQLRYFYVYALAGKVSEGKISYAEFEKILENFVGREFVMPKRVILADCAGKINYICAAKDAEQTLRVTAVDKNAAIHSFEYVKLSEKFDTKANDKKAASLAAILESAESFTDKTNKKIIRLTFAAGLVTILPG